VQLLPALSAGGVERGTVEFARELVKLGHRSTVISSGGTMVNQLQQEGSQHITLPIHKKSLSSLFKVKALRSTLVELKPDVVHVRSRVPAWLTHLALRKWPLAKKPARLSTFHGLYSVNAYSAIMAKADHIIAISDCVRDYIFEHYNVPKENVTRIYRGLDAEQFNQRVGNRQQLEQQHPQLNGKDIILMPGRLTRWKGQEDFISMMKHLIKLAPNCHGLIVGAAEANKQHYQQELEQLCADSGLTQHITFTGHRSDINQLYRISAVTCHMSTKAEPFGRTVPEALASGCPVVAYDRGGASESLINCFPQGLVAPDDTTAFAQRVAKIINQPKTDILLPSEFFLNAQTQNTLSVYRRVLAH
jgi:glycosyltransferase involved in cell wall biosynthesis